ncbi:MAG: PHP domain-containing protein [Limisphaerales bacterium]|jgi:predicted metal-dependent phosphoesterase TrpH|nr:PHP domain-containing protein [Verrucomicrobiota bacterium]
MSKLNPANPVADLHLHSHYSDGTYTPQTLVARALKTGLSCIALTDHDTLEGCAATQKLCEEAGIGFIAGVELTAYALGEEVHILGLHVNLDNEPFLEKMREFQEGRKNRIIEMVSLLNKEGVGLSVEEVLELAHHCSAPGRMHIAHALLRGKHCKSHDEAFSRYIGEGKVAWAPKVNCSIEAAVELLHGAGAAALVAHPGMQRDRAAVCEYAIEKGIDGFECYHPRHSNSTTRRLIELCQAHQLLISGGSDCHGVEERIYMGSIRLPIQYVEQLNQWVYSKNLKKA